MRFADACAVVVLVADAPSPPAGATAQAPNGESPGSKGVRRVRPSPQGGCMHPPWGCPPFFDTISPVGKKDHRPSAFRCPYLSREERAKGSATWTCAAKIGSLPL